MFSINPTTEKIEAGVKNGPLAPIPLRGVSLETGPTFPESSFEDVRLTPPPGEVRRSEMNPLNPLACEMVSAASSLAMKPVRCATEKKPSSRGDAFPERNGGIVNRPKANRRVPGTNMQMSRSICLAGWMLPNPLSNCGGSQDTFS